MKLEHTQNMICDVVDIIRDPTNEDSITMHFPEDIIENTEMVCTNCIKLLCNFLDIPQERFLAELDSPMGINEYRSDN